MAATHGPHQVAQNSNTTVLPFSFDQLNGLSAPSNTRSDAISGALLPTFGRSRSSAEWDWMAHTRLNSTIARFAFIFLKPDQCDIRAPVIPLTTDRIGRVFHWAACLYRAAVSRREWG